MIQAPQRLRSALAPHTAGEPLELLDIGFSFEVLATRSLVFRVPRTRAAAERLDSERALLLFVRHLPFAVPVECFRVDPSPGLPLGSSVARRLAGVPPDARQLGPGLGLSSVERWRRFIALHPTRPAPQAWRPATLAGLRCARRGRQLLRFSATSYRQAKPPCSRDLGSAARGRARSEHAVSGGAWRCVARQPARRRDNAHRHRRLGARRSRRPRGGSRARLACRDGVRPSCVAGVRVARRGSPPPHPSVVGPARVQRVSPPRPKPAMARSSPCVSGNSAGRTASRRSNRQRSRERRAAASSSFRARAEARTGGGTLSRGSRYEGATPVFPDTTGWTTLSPTPVDEHARCLIARYRARLWPGA